MNEQVIGDAYPLPNITDILDQLGRSQYFSVFDLASSYHQVETHPEDRANTAFSTPRGHFEYQRMPMGIKSAPAKFQSLMDTVLKIVLGTEAFVYLDDIVIYSETVVRQFLGLSGYYRPFIESYAKLAKPLTDLLKKGSKFIWGPEQEKNFVKLRYHLCQGTILIYPDYTKTFKLTTDASEYAKGAVLTQEVDKVDMSAAYFPKILTSIEQRYYMIEKECLAVLYAVLIFRPFLYGREFILAYDHEPVHWITYADNPGPRLLRWRYRLKDYQCVFKYKKGQLNGGVEALSRNPVGLVIDSINAEGMQSFEFNLSPSNSSRTQKIVRVIKRTSLPINPTRARNVLHYRNSVLIQASIAPCH